VHTLLGLLGIVFAGYIVRFARWYGYLRRLGYGVPLASSFHIFLSSFALTATPGKAGESMKAWLLKRRHGVPVAPTLASLFVERFTDVFSVVLVILAGLFALERGRMLVIGVAATQLVALGLLQRPGWVRRLLLPLAARARMRAYVRPLMALLDGAHTLLRPRALAGGLLLGGVPWLAEGAAMYVLFQVLGAETVALHEAILIHAAATLFGALTFLPGGLGGHEAASVSLSLLYGATQPQAVAATVLIRTLTLVFAVLVGIGCLMIPSSYDGSEAPRQSVR
jgi:uncharacterized membrane protein YbhN (UPF0104 family)